MKLIGSADAFHRQVLFSPWSVVHFVVGFAAFPILEMAPIDANKLLVWAMLHGLYELKDTAGAYFPTACKWVVACDKSFLSSVGDQVSAVLGYAAARALGVKSMWTALAAVVAGFAILYSPLFGEYEKIRPKGVEEAASL